MNKKHIINQGYYKYFNVDVVDKESFSGDDFDKLLEFIGRNRNYGRQTDKGNGYFAIRKRTDEILGLGKRYYYLKTSKREVASLRKIYISIDGNTHNCIKIPYKLWYIFQAVCELVEDIEKEGNDIPEELKKLVGKTYKEAFYEMQANAYNIFRRNNGINGEQHAANHIKDDLENHTSPLNKIFK